MHLISFIFTIIEFRGYRQGRDTSTAILPSKYKADMGQGFATNYFKTETPAEKYRAQNVQDVFDKGFRNLRLRCRADLYTAPYSAEDTDSKNFLDKLENVSFDHLITVSY